MFVSTKLEMIPIFELTLTCHRRNE